MVICVNIYQRCELKVKQGNNSPACSDAFRKAAMGTAHAALIRKGRAYEMALL